MVIGGWGWGRSLLFCSAGVYAVAFFFFSRRFWACGDEGFFFLWELAGVEVFSQAVLGGFCFFCFFWCSLFVVNGSDHTLSFEKLIVRILENDKRSINAGD